MSRDDAAIASEIVPYRTVTDDETQVTRPVVRDCKVCLAGAEVYGCGVVSPTGVAHIGMTGGDTKCGRDATLDGWWWPL